MHYFSGKGCSEFLESMHYCIGILNVPIDVCNTCKKDITSNIDKHMDANPYHAGWHTEYKKVFSHYEEVNHPAQYTNKWVVDKPAWTETITSYYCSCGAKK